MIVAVGAALRFATLGGQSFDFDELITVFLMRLSLGGMLAEIPQSECTTPLYYLAAWFWKGPFGTGEVGLRAMSALLGTAMLPVVYAAAREVGSRRVALIAALLAAVSPWLVWHSQQARTYPLLMLLGALSLLFFVRALNRRGRRTLAWWALASSLALACHYFAAFLVVPEAAWLLYAMRQRSVLLAVGAVAATGAALMPLALHQRGECHASETIGRSGSLATRTAQIPKQFVIGFDAPLEFLAAGAALLAVAVALALALLARRDSSERSLARVPLLIGAATVGIAILVALAGFDFVNARNLIVAWLPAALAVAVGLGTRRGRIAGPAALAVLTVTSLVAVVGVAVTPAYQREDWRGTARALGPPTVSRALVLTPYSPPHPYSVYLPGLQWLPAQGAAVREIAVVGVANTIARPGHGRRVPKPADLPAPAPEFRLHSRSYGATYTVLRFRSTKPVRVAPGVLRASRLDKAIPASLLYQR